MKVLKIIVIMGLLANLFSCNKIKNRIEKIENKINPGSPYKEAGIDRFYWEAEDRDKYIIPLIKPYYLYKWKGSDEWTLNTSILNWKSGDISPIADVNIKDIYIYGSTDIDYFGDDKNVINNPEFFFIINTKTKDMNTYDYKSGKKKFEEKLNYLGLPETYLEPQNIYWEFEKYPDLEWFPEDIKKQLREVKAKLNR